MVYLHSTFAHFFEKESFSFCSSRSRLIPFPRYEDPPINGGQSHDLGNNAAMMEIEKKISANGDSRNSRDEA